MCGCANYGCADGKELVLISDDADSIAQIVALAKSLNVNIEQRGKLALSQSERKELYNKIKNFNFTGESLFGDPLQWQIEERKTVTPYSQTDNPLS